MAGNLSTYMQAQLLNWLKGSAFASAPASGGVHCALFTTVPNQAGTGGVEVSGTGYARKLIAFADWGAPSGTTSQPYQIATTAQEQFTSSAGSAWGTINGAGFYDDGGNLLHVETFSAPVVVSQGLPVYFNAGDLTLTVSSATVSAYLAKAYLNWYRGTAFPSSPTNTYAALFLTVPAQDGTAGSEVTGTGYARQAIGASAGWSAVSGGSPSQISNAAQLNYGNAGSAWGTLNGEGLYDALTAGNLLFLFTYTSGQAVNNGAPVTQAVGNVVVTAD